MDNENNWGGVRPGAGRKNGSIKKGEHKTGRIVISCLESEENQIKELAKKANKNVSQFIIDSILKR